MFESLSCSQPGCTGPQNHPVVVHRGPVRCIAGSSPHEHQSARPETPARARCPGSDPLPTAVGVPAPLRTDVSVEGDRTVLRVIGEVDVATAPELKAAIDVACCGCGTDTVLLDLGGVDLMDATGVETLLMARRHCEARDMTLRLRAVGPRVRLLLTLTAAADALGLGTGDGGRC